MRQPFPRSLAAAAGAVLAALVEVLRIAREMLAIPTHAWLALAEVAGAVVLAAWGVVARVALAVYDRTRDALEWTQRHVRPAYGVIAVCVVAVVALVASQLLDYRGVSVGTAAYAEVETVAPAPEVDRARAAEAHGWAAIPLAVLALAVTVAAVRGRWRAARLLVPLGLAVVAVSVAVDAPRGLDAGGVSIAYEGAEAVLLEGFWAQLVAGAVLACCGPLLTARLRPAGDHAARRARHHRGRRPLRSSNVAQPPMGTEGTNP